MVARVSQIGSSKAAAAQYVGAHALPRAARSEFVPASIDLEAIGRKLMELKPDRTTQADTTASAGYSLRMDPDGVWVNPRGLFGLTDGGEVDADDFIRLFRGVSPLDEEHKLVRNAGTRIAVRGTRRHVFPPTSRSRPRGRLATPNLRAEIERAHNEAARESLERFAFGECGFTRRTAGGSRPEYRGRAGGPRGGDVPARPEPDARPAASHALRDLQHRPDARRRKVPRPPPAPGLHVDQDHGRLVPGGARRQTSGPARHPHGAVRPRQRVHPRRRYPRGARAPVVETARPDTRMGRGGGPLQRPDSAAPAQSDMPVTPDHGYNLLTEEVDHERWRREASGIVPDIARLIRDLCGHEPGIAPEPTRALTVSVRTALDKLTRDEDTVWMPAIVAAVANRCAGLVDTAAIETVVQANRPRSGNGRARSRAHGRCSRGPRAYPDLRDARPDRSIPGSARVYRRPRRREARLTWSRRFRRSHPARAPSFTTSPTRPPSGAPPTTTTPARSPTACGSTPTACSGSQTAARSTPATSTASSGASPRSTRDTGWCGTPDGQSRSAGVDVTFSPDKTVSALWAIADPGLRAKIERAHNEAAREALERFAFAECGYTRRRVGGTGPIEAVPADLVAAMFQHGESREQDPQLHTHCVVFNVARTRDDGKYRAHHQKPVYWWKLTMAAWYRAALAAKLQRPARHPHGAVRPRRRVHPHRRDPRGARIPVVETDRPDPRMGRRPGRLPRR